MSDLAGSATRLGTLDLSDRSERVSAESEREAQEWAALLLPLLRATEIPRGRPSEPAGNDRSAKAAGPALSRTPDAGSQIADTGGVNEEAPGRLVLEVSTEELGRLTLVLDRSAGSLNVLIAGSDGAQAALLAEKTALTQALAGGPVKLESLRILSSEALGTVLAELPSKAAKDPERAPRRPAESFGRHQKTTTRRLNVIG